MPVSVPAAAVRVTSAAMVVHFLSPRKRFPGFQPAVRWRQHSGVVLALTPRGTHAGPAGPGVEAATADAGGFRRRAEAGS